jgi:hypothetical protein
MLPVESLRVERSIYKRQSVTRRKRLRCASDSITLGILGTCNFRHFFEQVIFALKNILPQKAQK